MLEIVKIGSWLQFQKLIDKALRSETKHLHSGPWLYRGHPDAAWHLETTLERYAARNLDVGTYYSIMCAVKTRIETFTTHKWKLPNYQEFLKTFARHPFTVNNSVYEYMSYLRHYGFPTPFLDWTYSPFIAAYFAFRDVSSKAKTVAIYRLFASNEMWGGSVDETAAIYPINTSPVEHERHVLQQSVYTLCMKEKKGNVFYASHEDPYIISKDRSPWITKFILPASERTNVLHSLKAYNINAYSLFGSEESLLETLFADIYRNAKINKKIFGMNANDAWLS